MRRVDDPDRVEIELRQGEEDPGLPPEPLRSGAVAELVLTPSSVQVG
jgi:hypothetical protein